ncbi:hypothetical protein [Streptomyces sp. B6B3]|uniref:hypothetical protein n=1 Tax=Streptomyces sp. B6B3 TaxID=3153570 RepID=UPI00325D5ED4
MPADDRLLFRNTMRVTPGHLDAFSAAIRRAVEFAEREAPQILVDVFLDERELRATSFQLYADSQAVLRHWRLSDPYIQEVMRHCTIERFEVFGDPSEAVRAGLPTPDDGIDVSLTPRLTGYARLNTSAEEDRNPEAGGHVGSA